ATQPLDQLTQAFAVAHDVKGLTAGTHVHIQSVLRYIDANIDRVHLDPSLRNGARLAAQATVRVRWNGGQGSTLRNGLQGPGMSRPPVRHRIGNANRFGDPCLTRMRAELGPRRIDQNSSGYFEHASDCDRG